MYDASRYGQVMYREVCVVGASRACFAPPDPPLDKTQISSATMTTMVAYLITIPIRTERVSQRACTIATGLQELRWKLLLPSVASAISRGNRYPMAGRR